MTMTMNINSRLNNRSESWWHSLLFPSVLSQDALNNLRLYKYAGVDDSLVSKYILKHYWNWMLNFFPLWMAPNLITLLGFLFIVNNFILVLVFVPDLVGPGPSWVYFVYEWMKWLSAKWKNLYFSFALGLWMYSTFDNVDGKQARRTNSSSPLGELFDHGFDALNCSIGSIVQIASLGVGISHYSLITCLISK